MIGKRNTKFKKYTSSAWYNTRYYYSCVVVAPVTSNSSAPIPVGPATAKGATAISSSGRHMGALLLILCSSSGCLRALLLQVSCSALTVARGGALLIGIIGALLIAFLLVVSAHAHESERQR